MKFAWLAACALVSFATACDRAPGAGGLERRECVELTMRVDRLQNAELGTANAVARNRRVDRCMSRGTRAWADCVKFAETSRAVSDCDGQLN